MAVKVETKKGPKKKWVKYICPQCGRSNIFPVKIGGTNSREEECYDCNSINLITWEESDEQKN